MANTTGILTMLTNDSISDFPQDEGIYFGIIIGFIVVLLGTVGNGITVWAYCRNKNLQTSFNVLIANLCLIDLFFTVIVIPLTLPGYIAKKNVYPHSFCSFVGFLYYIMLASSLYNLVAIAINRYVGIVWASRYQKLFSGRRLGTCIASIWLIPFVLYLPLIAKEEFAWEKNLLRCAVGNAASPVMRWYLTGLNITFQAIPLIILVVAYTAIFLKVKKVKAKMKGHQKTRKSVKTTSSASGSFRHKSGNTSDDTGDELRPSSLIEGIGFKPVNNVSEQRDTISTVNETGQKNQGKEDQHFLEQQQSSSSISDEPNNISIKKLQPKRRNSLWSILLQNKKIDKDINKNDQQLDNANNFLSSASDMREPDGYIIHSQPMQAKYDNCSEIFGEQIEMSNLQRKKSLSTPNLASIDLANFNLSRSDSKRSSSTHLKRYVEDTGKLNDNMKRPSSINGKHMRTRTQSDTTEKTQKSIQVKRTKKNKASISSVAPGVSDNESANGAFSRQSTRKKSDRKQKDDERKLQRTKTLRRKQARERQLAYSSFMICIAFAICILPTSLIYVIRTMNNLQVAATPILIVSCISWLHSVVNPWIYGYLNLQYRREYLRIMTFAQSKICRLNRPQTKT